MKKITEITRRDIFALFLYGMEITELFETNQIRYDYYGRLAEIDFLKRNYDLESLESYDSRFDNAAGDIWQHTVTNDDYEAGWIFEDDHFQLMNGEDEILLKFLSSVFHPAVRYESGYWREFLDAVNGLLRNDGYELFPESQISGRDVYGWRKYNPEEKALFIPFSQRYAKEIKAKHIMLKLSLKVRQQIYNLFEKYSTFFQEMDENGWQSIVTTEKYVFRDIAQFYEPRCYDENKVYSKTDDMHNFIMKTSPFNVLDAIEFYSRHISDNNYIAQINAILKLHDVPYKLDQGKIENTLEIPIDKNDIASISEKGLKELVIEENEYYRSGNKQIAVEKIWDSYERLKTYYAPELNKSDSASKIIEQMSTGNKNFKEMYEVEFNALTKIGNNYRIRHHEKNKINIIDSRQYDYFYKRCFALLSTAIQYLDGR